MNYFNTYSLMLRITSIQILIVITTINKLEIHQMNIKITFLNGNLNEEVHMEQPNGAVVNEKGKKYISLSNHYIAWNKHLNNDI